MPVSIPERTVDAWVAAYLAITFPSVVLWAPTQQHHPDHDLAVGLPGPGKLFVLENKAPETNRGGHAFTLPVRQLYNYLRHPKLRTRAFYVLPCPPYPVAAVPPVAAPPPAPSQPLLDARATTRLAGHRWAPPEGAEQWFFVIAALDLWNALTGGIAAPPVGASWWAPNAPPPPGAMVPGVVSLPLACPLVALGGAAVTLESFLDEVKICRREELWIEPRDVGYGEPDEDGALITHDTLLVAFVPSADLHGG